MRVVIIKLLLISMVINVALARDFGKVKGGLMGLIIMDGFNGIAGLVR